MNIEGSWSGGTNDYQYNGNEVQPELDGNVSDFNFRTYDSGIGRFWQADILTEWAMDLTPYRFGFNNPVQYADPLGLWEENEEGWTTDNPEEIADFMKSLDRLGDQGYSVQRGDGLDDEAFRMMPDDLSGVNILHNRDGNPSVSNQKNFPAGPNSEQNLFGYPNPYRSPAIESVDDPFTFAAGGIAKSLIKSTVVLASRVATVNAAKWGWMNGSTVLGADAATALNASRIIPEVGVHQVLLHGTGDGFIVNGAFTSAKELARTMLQSGFQRGTPVRLISCHTGVFGEGAAYQLSRYLRSSVMAPTNKIRILDGGGYEIFGGGRFRTFFNTTIK